MLPVLIALAGIPNIVVSSGTLLTTTELAPILDPFPTFIGPIICAPEPITTSSPTLRPPILPNSAFIKLPFFCNPILESVKITKAKAMASHSPGANIIKTMNTRGSIDLAQHLAPKTAEST